MNAFAQEKVSRAGAPDATQDAPNDLVVTIVMPCLNEAESLAPCIEMAHEGLRIAGVKGEILIADNGSTDGSQELAESLGARVAHIQARGYGSALQGGIAAARGKYVLMGDADGSYDFRHLNRFLERLDEGYDLVMGNRFAGGIAKGAMPPLHQYFGNPGLSWLGRLFFKSKVGDFYCGLRAFRRDAMDKLHLQSPGMEFGVEMVAKASMYDLKVTQVPTTLSPDLRSRPPHLRTWRDGWRTLRFFLLYSPRWLFFYPGMLLMLVGADSRHRAPARLAGRVRRPPGRAVAAVRRRRPSWSVSRPWCSRSWRACMRPRRASCPTTTTSRGRGRCSRSRPAWWPAAHSCSPPSCCR